MNPEAQNLWQGDQPTIDAAVETPPPSAPPTATEQPPVAVPPEGAPAESTEPAEPVEQSISWEASEYILHEKDPRWFIGLAAGAVVLILIAAFLIKSLSFTILVVAMLASVVVYARRPPRTLSYRLSHHALQIDEKHYSLHEFRSFGILQEGGVYSVMLIPTKRFLPGVSLYFPPELGEAIVDTLGSTVPMEKLKFDFIDKLARKMRF